jgi:carbonic anhydrase/acetyltransferase-like protein (isoleucine patch superfamily)
MAGEASMREFDFSGRRPEVDPEAFVAEGAVLVGRVVLGKGASVWYNCVLRADVADILIGENANVQDNCVIHVDFDAPTILEANVTVGHGAILHACTIEENCIVGMGATVLDGAVIRRDSIVGAGALVPPRKTYPPGSLLLGAPAKVARTLTEEERKHLVEHALDYVAFGRAYRARGIGRI